MPLPFPKTWRPALTRRFKPANRFHGTGWSTPRGRRRARTPTVLQMEAVECGAASLAMVLGHHGRSVPLEELRIACGISRDGSKASNLLRAARKYGLVARGFRVEPSGLRSMEAPLILHWNFNHFVVLEGFRRGRVYLNDPSGGPTVVSEEELDRAFTGVALTFSRGPDFQSGGAAIGLLASLRSRLLSAGRAVAFALLAGGLLTFAGLVIPSFSRIFVDEILVKGLTTWLKPLLWVMGLTAILCGVLTWLQQRHLLRLESRLALSTSSRFFWHVLRLPVPFFTLRFAGDLASRVAINDRIAQLLSGQLASTLLSVLLIGFYAILMLQYDSSLTALVVTIALLNMAALKWVSRSRRDANQRLLQDRGRLLAVAMGGLQTIETFKASGSESDFFARWAGHQTKVLNAQQELAFQTQSLAAIPPLLMMVGTALTLGLGAHRVMDGHLSIGMLVAFQALMVAFIAPVHRLVDLGTTLQEVQGDMARLDDVLRAPVDPLATEERIGRDLPESGPVKLYGQVELRSVTFGYAPLDPPLIENLSLTLKPGSRVALVGGSGSGKSTVARLVCGLLEPWSGEVLFDGSPRSTVPRQLMTSSLAAVDQEVLLFEGTVTENLTLWDEAGREADIVEAARDACIHEDLTARAGSYSGSVEEGGRNFSGGQRQRLEIARALVGNPSILVLDEATSALDAETERLIDDNLRRRGATCLIVAHRLSTIRDCDEIIVLERGKIVQRGTHEALKGLGGSYRELMAAE